MDLPNYSLFLVMICFWVTFWLVHSFLIKPVDAVLDERRQKIDGAEREWSSKHEDYLSATQRLEAEMEEAARQATAVRSEYRHKAQAERQARLEAAREAADDRLRLALDELERDVVAARHELRTQAEKLGRLFASQLLEREVSS
jgi:F0F1-type ATP synthase membrane subunit b/b'